MRGAEVGRGAGWAEGGLRSGGRAVVGLTGPPLRLRIGRGGAGGTAAGRGGSGVGGGVGGRVAAGCSGALAGGSSDGGGVCVAGSVGGTGVGGASAAGGTGAGIGLVSAGRGDSTGAAAAAGTSGTAGASGAPGVSAPAGVGALAGPAARRDSRLVMTRRSVFGMGGGVTRAGAAGCAEAPRLTSASIWSRCSGSRLLNWFFTSMPCCWHSLSKSMLSMLSIFARA